MTLEINGHRGYRVIEDVKADATELYKLRKQLIELTNSCIINNIKASEVNKWVTTIPKTNKRNLGTKLRHTSLVFQ